MGRTMRRGTGVLALLLLASTAQASFIITVPDATVTANAGTTIVDVRLSRLGASGFEFPSDYEFEFTITPLTDPFVHFDVSSETTTLDQTDYIYFGNSLSEGLTIGSVTPTVPPWQYTVFSGGDGAADFSPVTIAADGSNGLLVRLVLSATAPPDVPLTSFFTLTMTKARVSGSSLDFDLGADFDQDDSKLSATITLNVPGAAVPEPGSLTLLGCGAVVVAGAGWVRRRR